MFQIKSIDTDISLSDSFIRYGIQFPKRFPYMLPRFHKTEADSLNPDKNFFYRNGIFKGWLAVENEKPVGRIAAMINPDIYFEKGKLGIIGLYDATENYQNTKQLLDEAIMFLKSHDCTHVWGPMNFSIWHNYRFKTDHFEDKPFIGEPQNPPYYPDFFKQYGFETVHKWETRMLDIHGMRIICHNFKPHFESALKLGYTSEKVTKDNIKFFLELAWELISDTYAGFVGFSNISKLDFMNLYGSLPKLLDINVTFFIKDPTGQYIGFMIVLKDQVDAIKAMKGRSNFWSKIKFKLNEGKSESANIYQFGIKSTAREELTIRQKEFDKPFSLGKAFTYLTFYEILKLNKYKYAISPLMTEDAPTRKYSENIYIKSMHYDLLELKL